jgi:hypothetical protein
MGTALGAITIGGVEGFFGHRGYRVPTNLYDRRLSPTILVNAVAISWRPLLCEPVAIMRTVGHNGPMQC